MKLRRLHVGRLPGIDEPFTVEELSDGLHIVVGPNGIGKSSLCRAARALLWPARGPVDGIAVSALFEHDGARWSVERDGTRYRWQRDGVETEPPPLPAEHLHRCFFLGLRDLLESTSDAGSEVAAQIRRQMSGGFDLEGAEKSTFGDVGPRYGKTERDALSRSDGEIHRAEQRQEQLARRAAQLTALEREAAEAEEAQREVAHLERAFELQQLCGRRDDLERTLRDLPESLARLTGTEATQLDEREHEREEIQARRARTEKELARAREAQAGTRLEETLDAAALSAWRARADELADLEGRLADAQREWDGKREALVTAARAVGGRTEAPPELDLGGDGELFAFLREAWRVEQTVESLRERLALLGERRFSAEEHERLELLRRAVDGLRAWLRAPEPGAGVRLIAGMLRWQLVAAVGAVLLLAGSGLAAALHSDVAAVAGAGLALIVAAWLLRPDPRAGYAREAAERDLPAGVAPPVAWASAGVGERLRELESDLAELEASAVRARDRDVERAALGTPLADAERRRSALDARRGELAAALGLDEIPAGAELVDTARALDQLRKTRAEEREAAAQVTAIAARHADLLEQLAAALASHGESAPADAAAARAGVAQLAARDAALRVARDRQTSLAETRGELDDDLDRVGQSIVSIYARAGLAPGDRAGLMRLLDRLEGYRASSNDREVLSKSIEQAESRLGAAGKSSLADVDPEALASAQARCQRQAAGLERLRGDISDIRAEVRQARDGHQLEDLLAARAATAERLQEKRDEALRAAAGRFLLRTVRREHETIQMPRVLARARGLFATFTHDAYELQVAPDDAASFVAVEARSGAGRSPDQLSDGTRAQLLLAVRLAFTEEAERGAELPLFLDEALDQSDPVRFHAIARSLARMVADEGRQILYLTNDPGDEQRLQAALREEGCALAPTIDLAAIRRRTRSLPGAAALTVEPLPAVPAPAGESPERYGARLGVPPLDPGRGASDQHLFHLLHDDLGLLHALLERRLEHVGQWQTLSHLHADVAGRLAASHPAAVELDARIDLLAEFCRAWSEGRGRPVDRGVIERSSAVTERYLDAVADIAGELDGNGEQLLETLKARHDERLRGFRSGSAEALEQFLVDEGYLDPRPVLDEAAIVARVMAAPAASRLAGAAAAAMVHRWWVVSGRALAREARPGLSVVGGER